MQKTLKKILDELNKESPRLDYIKGMLEVLIEDNQMQISSGTTFVPYVGSTNTGLVHGTLSALVPAMSASASPTSNDEGAMMDVAAKAKVEKIRLLAEESNK